MEKAQSLPKSTDTDDDCSAGSGNVVSLLPSGSKKRNAPPETDDSGVAAAAPNEPNTDNANTTVTKREGTAVGIGESKTKRSRDLNAEMEDEPDKPQSLPKTAGSDDDRSAGSGNVVSLLPCGTESEEKKTPEETDDCGIASAASNKANTCSENTSSDLSMPWVKELPVHLLAAFFQRMAPPVKRQVEMTTQRIANIMKAHGCRKYDSIDIIFPDYSSGSFRVNDSIDVKRGDVVDCVQLLLARIPVRRFSMKDVIEDADSYPYDVDFELDPVMVYTMNALLDTLLKSKNDGVAIRELQLDVPAKRLMSSTVGEVITAFSDTLTHISTPKLDNIATDAIGKCDHLEALAFARIDSFEFCGDPPLGDNALKDALAAKSSLTSLSLEFPVLDPFKILIAGVHHLKHLAIYSLARLRIPELTADQAQLMSNLSILEIAGFSCNDYPKLLNILRTAPELERLHITGKGYVRFTITTTVYGIETDPGDISLFMKDLADECYRTRRSLTFSARFRLSKIAQGMLATMMAYDKKFVTSPNLSQYGVMAFDERLHKFDANLKPPTTETPPQITTIDGSRVYKRVFTIDMMPGVRLSIGFDESPELEEEFDEEESDEEDDDQHPEMCLCDMCNEESA